MGTRIMAKLMECEVTRNYSPLEKMKMGALPFTGGVETGSATVRNAAIELKTETKSSLFGSGLMARTRSTSDEVIKRDGLAAITTRYKHCPCDPFAATAAVIGGVKGFGLGAALGENKAVSVPAGVAAGAG